MKKTKFLLRMGLFLLLLCTCMQSCNKRCRCTRGNMTVDYYTPEELSQRNKTCQEMIYLNGLATQYYIQCEWEY